MNLAKPSEPLELSLRGFILGALITMVFTSSNLYLGLKAGLTFSSSIPAAVISMAVLSFFAHSNILENNMVQTQASAAGTLSSVIFVLPAILMVGYWQQFHFWQTMLICAAGGCLGVIFSIPLRRTMVVGSDLPYPEGKAAAEILIAGHQEDTGQGGARDILFGGLWAAAVSLATSGFRILSDKAYLWHQTAGGAVFQFPLGFSLAMVSAGFLMGLAGGAAMLIGLVLAWGLFVPVMTAAAPDLGTDYVAAALNIWDGQVRYIGAGCLAIAAVWTLITFFKPMMEGIKMSFKAISGAAHGRDVERTDQDLSMKWLLILLAVILAVLALTMNSFVRASSMSGPAAWGLVGLGVAMIFLIGFFIAAACGYMAGLIGSSNSPISGIGIIATIIISVTLVLLNSAFQLFTGPEGQRFGMALTLFIGTGVVSVACIANDNLQDLKTGQLVGATPRNQQIALLVGCLAGAAVIAPVLGILYEAYGFAGAVLPRPEMNPADALSAPQATLMRSITQGIFAGTMDWTMFLSGLGLGAVVIALDAAKNKLRPGGLRISALAVGLGIYLPAGITAAIVVGSFLKLIICRRLTREGKQDVESETGAGKKGVLIASGFIVGESLTGVVMAIVVLISLSLGYSDAPLSLEGLLSPLMAGNLETVRNVAGALVFILGCAVFYKKSTS